MNDIVAKTLCGIMLVIPFLILSIWILLYYRNSGSAEFEKYAGFPYSKDQILYEDTEKSFGDGLRRLILQGTDEQRAFIEQNWMPLPVDDEKAPFLYGTDEYISPFCYPDSNERFFPEIKEGFYVFVNLNQGKNWNGVTTIGESVTVWNDVIVLMYNSSDNKIYYIKYNS